MIPAKNIYKNFLRNIIIIVFILFRLPTYAFILLFKRKTNIKHTSRELYVIKYSAMGDSILTLKQLPGFSKSFINIFFLTGSFGLPKSLNLLAYHLGVLVLNNPLKLSSQLLLTKYKSVCLIDDLFVSPHLLFSILADKIIVHDSIFPTFLPKSILTLSPMVGVHINHLEYQQSLHTHISSTLRNSLKIYGKTIDVDNEVISFLDSYPQENNTSSSTMQQTPTFCLYLGSGKASTLRSMPIDKCLFLIKTLLLNFPNSHIYLFGSASEINLAETLKSYIISSSFTSLVSRLDPIQTLLFLKRINNPILICTDGGFTHLARLLPIKLIQIFFSSSSNQWGYKDNKSITLDTKKALLESEFFCYPCNLPILGKVPYECKSFENGCHSFIDLASIPSLIRRFES